MKEQRKSLIKTEKSIKMDSPKQGVLHLKKGLTESLGNYESARADVGIDVPFELENLDQVFDETSQWIDEKLDQEMDNLYQIQQKKK